MPRPAQIQTFNFHEWKRSLQRKKLESTFTENWLDTQQLCSKLGISLATVRRKIKSGIIPQPSYHLGEYMPRWAESEIDTLMDSVKE